MPKRTTGTRAQALRKAREAKAERDARVAEREARITEILADYYAASQAAADLRVKARTTAHGILTDAQNRADHILAQAAEQIAEHDANRHAALAALRDLGERPADIATLCGLAVTEVRLLLRDACKRQ